MSDPVVCRTFWQRRGHFVTVFHVRPDHMQDSLAELSVCDFSMSDPAVCRTCWQRRGQVVTVFHVRPNCLQDLLAEKVLV